MIEEPENTHQIDITRVTWTLQDDIVYNNPAISLYATGCSWKCKGCYNKELWDFEHPDNRKYKACTLIDYINAKSKYLPSKDISIVGVGGDFWFQVQAWLGFIKEVKEALPDVKTVWYTGAAYSAKPKVDLTSIDAILWGALASRDGKVYKTISKSDTNHSDLGEILVNDYDSTHEDTYPTHTGEQRAFA